MTNSPSRLGRLADRLLERLGAPAKRSGVRSPRRPRRSPGRVDRTPDLATGAVYPGDFTGPLPRIVYSPSPDGRPDPGEVVWTRVPYQEDPSRGKDRPVLLIGRDGAWLLALTMTSQDHDRDAAQERAAGRIWVDIGSGGWDSRGRPSEVGLHRVIRVDPAGVRREGSVLAADRFAEVVAALVGFRGSHA